MECEELVKVGLIYNAFDPTVVDKHDLVFQKDNTLADYLVGIPEGVEYKVALNGEPIKDVELVEVKPAANDLITVAIIPQGKVGKTVLRIVALVAVVVAAAWLVSTLGLTGLAAIAVFTATVAIGGFIINALLPAGGLNFKKQKEDDQAYGYDGAKNTAKEGVALPVVYGEFRVAGNYVDLFTENVGDDQYLYGRTVLSDGEIDSVSEPEINEQPITDYQNILYNHTLGTYTDPVNSYFGREIAQKQRQVKLSDTSYSTYTTTTDVDAIQVNLAFPRGLVTVDKKGNKNNRSVTVEAEYRVAGSGGAWTAFGGRVFQSFSPSSSAFGDFFNISVQPTVTSSNQLGEQVTYTIQYKKTVDATWTTWNTVTETITNSAVDSSTFSGGLFNIVNLNSNVQWLRVANTRTYNIVTDTPSTYEFRVLGNATITGISVAGDGFSTNQFTFTDKRTRTIRKTIETGPIARETYEVRVRRTANEVSNDDYIVEELWLTDIGEIQNSGVALRSVATGWYKVKMTDQLNSVPNITWKVKGVKVNKYDVDGNILATEWSANPAWIALDMLISERRGAFPNISVDYPAYVDWANYCDDNEFYFNGVFDDTTSLWDALQTVYRVGRATPTRLGVKLSVALDRPSTPVMLFGPGNIVKDSFKIDYMSLADRATEYEVSYYDREDRNKQKTLRVVDPVAESRGLIPKPVQFTLFGVDNFEQAKKEIWFQLYQNRLLKRSVSFDAPIEALGLSIGDVAYIQHDLVEWGQAGRLEGSNTTSVIHLDKQVTVEAGKTYKLLVIHDYLDLATATISGSSGNIVNLSSMSASISDESKAHKLVTDTGKEHTIISYSQDTSYTATVYLDDDFVSGTSATIKQVDAIEESEVQDTAGDYTTLTVSPSFSKIPNKYSNYMFGEESSVKRPFRLRAINGTDLETRSLTFIEYNELVYSEPEFDIPTPAIRFSKTVRHVENLIITNDFREFGGDSRVSVAVSWTSGNVRNYGGADVYVSLNGANFVFEKSVLNTNEVHLEAYKDATISVKVVAFDNTGIRANVNTAPYTGNTLISSVRELSAPTGLAWTLDSYPFYANGKLTWANPTDANKGRATRVQVKLSGSSTWDDWGVTTEEFILINEIPSGTHDARVRSELNSSISQWTTTSFSVTAPSLITPVIATDGTAVDHVINTDGSATISFEYTWGGNAKDIDGFIITYYSSTSSSAYIVGTDPTNEISANQPVTSRSFILEGVPCNRYYTFYIKAYKKIHSSFASSGMIYSTNVKPSISAENPYRPQSNVAFGGDITGTINGVPVADISAIVSDNILDKQEKFSLLREYQEVDQTYSQLINTAQSYGLMGISEYNSLATAKSDLDSYLSSLSPAWNDTTQNTTIVGNTFNTKWNTVYSAMNSLNNRLQNLNVTSSTIYDPFSQYISAIDFQKYWSVTGSNGEINLVTTSDIGGKAIEFGNNAGNDFVIGQYIRRIPYSPEDLYSITWDFEIVNSASGASYLGIAAYDVNGNNLTSDWGNYCYVAASGLAETTTGRKRYTGYFRGTAIVGTGSNVGAPANDKASPSPLPAGTVAIAPIFLTHYPSDSGKSRIHEVKLSKEDVNVTFTGLWSSTKSYYVYESVAYLGRTFASKASGNLNHTPPSTATSDSFWYLIADKGTDGSDGQAVDIVYIKSVTQPSTPSASSGVPAGWSATVAGAAGTGLLWASVGERATPSSNYIWQTPVKVEGQNGADAYTVSPASQAFNINCTSNGVPKTGEFNKTVTYKVLQGTTDVSDDAGTTYSVSTTNCTASMGGTNNKVLTVTSMSSSTAKCVVTIQRSGVTIATPEVNLTKTLDGTKFNSGTASISSMPNSTSFSQLASFSLSVPNGAFLSISAAAQWQAQAGTTYAGEIRTSYTNTTDVLSEQFGTAGASHDPPAATDTEPTTAEASQSFTNSTGATKVYTIRVYGRRTSGSGAGASVSGTLYAESS